MKKLLNIYDHEEEIIHKKNLMKFTKIHIDYITFKEINYRNNKEEFIHVTIIDDPNFENKVKIIIM